MNKWLKGNGYWCSDCRGTGCGQPRDRIEFKGGGYCQFYDTCLACNGEKRIAATLGQIMANTVPSMPRPERHTILDQTIEYVR